jgi:hypothetical protein
VHNLRLRARDSAGKVVTTNQTIQIDTVTPALDLSVAGSAGTNGWYRSNVQLDAAASDAGSGLGAFEYDLDGAGWMAYSTPLDLSDGIHSLSMRAVDTAGNSTAWTQSFQVDTLTPALDLTVGGTLGTSGWYISPVQIDLAASDPGSPLSGASGLSSLEYNLDGAGWSIYTAPLGLSDGVHSLSMRAVDGAGNSTTWTQSFQVDTLTPLLDLTASGALGASGWYTSPVQIDLAASDPDSPLSGASGLNALEYNLDGAGWAAYSIPLELSDGFHNLELRAIDLAGNVTGGTQGFQVDAAPPTLDVNVSGTQGTSPWYVSIVQVEAVAGDVTSALSTLEVKVDGGDWRAYNAAQAFGDGPHSYRFRARDNAGNLAETPLHGLQVDTIPPAISLPESWELGEIADFELLDNGSGLASVRLVIEDKNGQYPEVIWEDALASYTFDGEINWDGRFGDGSLAPPGGEYYASLKVIDNAGNESQDVGQINVLQVNDDDHDSSGGPVSGTEGSDPIVVSIPDSDVNGAPTSQPLAESAPSTLSLGGVSNEAGASGGQSSLNLGGGSNDAGASGGQSALNLGGGNNGAAQPSNAQTGMMSFNAGGQSTSPLSNAPSNLLWGATATAAIGAFTAEILRKKQEEEAKMHERVARQEMRAERREGNDYRQKVRGEKLAELEEEWANERALANLREHAFDVANQARKEELLEVEIPPEKPTYHAFNSSWKERDYAQTEHSQEMAATIASQLAESATENTQEQQSWWEKTLDWIDNNQVATSIGVGVAVGLGAAAIILTGGAALPVILGAVAVSGLITGGGTIALNAHFQRDWNDNLLRNSISSITATILTAGITVIGAKVIGAGITACTMNPACANLIEPAMKVIDFIEETSLVVKAGVQTFFGDSIGAGETLLELEMEHLDGGTPGNSLAKELGEETLELLALQSDDAIKLIREYGDDAIEIISRFGNDGIALLTTYGDDAVHLYEQYGKDVIPLLLAHGDDAVDIIGAYGDEGVALLTTYGKNAIGLVKDYGTPAVSLLGTLNPDSANKLLKNLDGDVIEYALTQGPDAVAALSHWPDDFLRKYGDELALRAKQDARALEAASKLVKLKDLNTQEAKELLDTIAYNSVQNSGDRLVLGKWVSGTLDEGFIGAARADGALFYGTNPGIEELFAKANSTDPEDLYWGVNNRVLEIATEQNLKIDYSLNGLPSESVPIEISAINAIQSGMKSGEVAEKFFKGNFPFRMKEVEVLIAHGYTFTVDATNNIIHWSMP